MGSSVGTALLLTLMGAAGTAIGGILVVIQPSMSYKKLGALQVMQVSRGPNSADTFSCQRSQDKVKHETSSMQYPCLALARANARWARTAVLCLHTVADFRECAMKRKLCSIFLSW